MMANYIFNLALLTDFALLRVKTKFQQTLRKQDQHSEPLGPKAEDSFSSLS
jgi:hypothetical protein